MIYSIFINKAKNNGQGIAIIEWPDAIITKHRKGTAHNPVFPIIHSQLIWDSTATQEIQSKT